MATLIQVAEQLESVAGTLGDYVESSVNTARNSALVSEGTAKTSLSAATASASTASTQAGAATTSAANALAYSNTTTSTATSAATQATNATNSATTAASEATSALAFANTSGSYIAAWVSGTTYSLSQAARDTTDGRIYRRIVAGAGTTRPGLDSTNWKAISTLEGSAEIPTIPPSLNLNLLSSVLDPRVTFSRASVATRFNSKGLLEVVPSGVARFDYDPITLACRGFLVEESRTNLLTQSGAINTTVNPSIWSKGVNTTIANQSIAAPDGTLSAVSYTGDGSGANEYVLQSVSLQANTTYTISVWARIVSGSTPTAGNIISASYNNGTTTIRAAVAYSGNISSTFTRFSVTFTNVTAGSYSMFFAVDQNTTAEIALWGAQLEAGSFPTSYIPTTSVQVTRSADVATMTGTNFSDWYRQDEGTFVVEGRTSITYGGSNQFPFLLQADDGTNNNKIQIIQRVLSPYTDANYSVLSAGATQASFDTNTNTTTFKFAVAAKANDFAFAVGGSVVNTDTSGVMPVGVNRLTPGSNGAAVNFLNGHIRKIIYYPTRCSNLELQALTR
jgi:hypothetical protein